MRKTCSLIALLFFLFLPPGVFADSGSGFDLTATERNFSLYFPTYLANGFFTTSSSLRGTDPTLSLMVGVIDYTPGDVPRPAALPSWAEMDYFDGVAWLNATPVTAGSFRDYRQTLQMYDGVLSTQYVFASSGHSTRVAVNTFVSEDAPHLGVTSLSLTPDFAGTVRLRFTLRPHAPPTHRFPLASVPSAELRESEAQAEAQIRLSDPTAPERGAEWYPGYVNIQSLGASEAQRVIWITVVLSTALKLRRRLPSGCLLASPLPSPSGRNLRSLYPLKSPYGSSVDEPTHSRNMSLPRKKTGET